MKKLLFVFILLFALFPYERIFGQNYISVPVLKRLFEKEAIKINKADGKVTIANSEEVFLWIDPDFKNWGLNDAGKKTKKIPVEVYEITQNVNFKTILDFFNQNIDNLCLTQAQIVDFCKNHQDLLHYYWPTIFFFEENDEHFIAYVYMSSGCLHVDVLRSGDVRAWLTAHCSRLVVPKLNNNN